MAPVTARTSPFGTLGWLAYALATAACSSSSSTPATSVADGGGSDATSSSSDGGGTTADGGAATGDAAADSGGTGTGCGLAFYPSDTTPACQLLLDKYCCPAERACGGDPTCNALVACVNACAPPRQADCINACGAGSTKLDAIAACTKAPPYQAPPGIDCAWPQ
jgi:hypothetical protein